MSRIFTSEQVERQKDFMITKIIREFGPDYNIPPRANIPVIVPGSRILDLYRWGLIPFWAKDSSLGDKMINARSETLTEKPAFNNAFMNHRCLILCSGFYEWQSKMPFYFHLKNTEIMALAGLYSKWENPADGEKINTCTIITTNANDLVKEYHHRMPVILPKEAFKEWLDPGNTDVDLLQIHLKPFDSSQMVSFPVSPEINSPKFNSEKAIDRFSPESTGQNKLF